MKKVFLVIAAFCLINSVRAGGLFDLTPDYGDLFRGGTDDAKELLKAYMSPYANAFGASLSGGWYNTAKAHKPLGFDLTITANVGIVPKAERTFDVGELNLTTLELEDPDNSIAQTAAGKRETGPQMQIDGNDAFTMPQGTGMAFFMSPMIQAGVGIFKDTEILGRYMPTVTSGSTELGLWGIGLKHGLKQWIPFIKKVPLLHLSLMGGYTQFNTKYTLGSDDQYMGAKVTSLTGNLLASINFPVVCIYGSLGFNTSKTTLALRGEYPTYNVATMAVESSPANFDIEVKNTDGSATDPRVNLGLRFKMAVITIHADYTWADYSVITAGLGITVR